MHCSKKWLYMLLINCLVITLILSGCHQQTKVAENSQNSATRLIVTNSDALEMIVGLGAAENIVGVNDNMGTLTFADTESRNWSSIGNWQNPNIEAVVNLNPDVVIAYQRWPDPAGFDDKLKPFNISVERINCFYMSEYQSDIHRLAALVGRENMADTMVYDFERIVNMLKSRVTDVNVKKTVYFERSDFVAMGIETGYHEMLELANATNIAAKLSIPYPRVSTEWLLEENPDIIIKIISADTITIEMYDNLISRAGWNKLNAVNNGRVYLISNDICSGPRAMIGSLFIAKWCYPERFADVNPDDIHSQWLKKYYGVDIENITFAINYCCDENN